jgi:hypothetical protein
MRRRRSKRVLKGTAVKSTETRTLGRSLVRTCTPAALAAARMA